MEVWSTEVDCTLCTMLSHEDVKGGLLDCHMQNTHYLVAQPFARAQRVITALGMYVPSSNTFTHLNYRAYSITLQTTTAFLDLFHQPTLENEKVLCDSFAVGYTRLRWPILTPIFRGIDTKRHTLSPTETSSLALVGTARQPSRQSTSLAPL